MNRIKLFIDTTLLDFPNVTGIIDKILVIKRVVPQHLRYSEKINNCFIASPFPMIVGQRATHDTHGSCSKPLCLVNSFPAQCLYWGLGHHTNMLTVTM